MLGEFGVEFAVQPGERTWHTECRWRRRPSGGNDSIGFIGRGRALPGFVGAKGFRPPRSIFGGASFDLSRRQAWDAVIRKTAPAQPQQGSFVPVRMLGGLNFGGQMTMTAELPGGTRLLIPVADRCAKYTKAGHPRVRVPEADLDKQVLAVFDKMRIEDEGVRD
jgi:hypothetical protein